MGVDVSRRHAGHAEARGERLKAAVERAVVARERALELDPERVAPEGRQQAAHRRLVAHALARAAAQADEPLGVLLDLGERDARRVPGAARALTRVRVRAREQAAEARPAARVAHQQRQVAVVALARSAVVAEAQLRPVDRAQAEPLGGLRELHRAADRVVIGQRQRRVPALDRRRDELLGQ